MENFTLGFVKHQFSIFHLSFVIFNQARVDTTST
jgi:hypothetical protein